jgi:hypothetical protein
VQRIALIFTVLVFSVVIGGLLSRHGTSKTPTPRKFEPGTTPALPHLVDPLGARADPQGVRSDRLTLQIVDPAGSAVPGAALIVRSGNATIWAFSGADGTATLEGLAPGTSSLAVLAFPHPGLEVDIEPGPDVRRIALEANATPPVPLADILRSKFAGELRQSGSEPLAGCEVVLLPTAAPSDLGGALLRRSAVDTSGKFSFEGLAHGEYLLVVLPEWASGGSWPDLAAEGSRKLSFVAEVGDGVVELARGAIEGEVRDDLGRALEGALVLVNDAAIETHVWPPSSTGPDGRFRVPDLPPGKYRVSCRAGESGSTIEELLVAAGAPTWAALPSFAARKRP